MKNILILAEGVLAKHFINRLAGSKLGAYYYTVISNDERITKMELNKQRFKLLEFDPTSLSKFKFNTSSQSYAQAIIVTSSKRDTYACYENIREVNKEVEVVMLSMWSLTEYKDVLENDKRLDVIDGKNTMATKLVDSLPEMPLFADNIGLGEGEIMEVRVPAHSPYAYRNIGSIQQRKWRIALVIREGDIVLPNSAEKIRPGDSLITVGDPNVLENVFRAIKRDQAQFPNPFGTNIYCLIDMSIQNEADILRLIDSALFMHYKIANKKLFFKVLNPTLNSAYEALRVLDEAGVSVMIEYENIGVMDILGDTANLDIGLVISDSRFFFKFKKELYSLGLPVLKIGDVSLQQVNSGVILGGDEDELQDHSAVIMDVCSQLGLRTELFCYNTQSNTNELIDYFDGLSRLFEKSVKVSVFSEENPLLMLQKRSDFMQFVIFDEAIVNSDFWAVFSTKFNRLYRLLSKNAQLFIPSSDKFE
ncbi:COG3400 family protein [Campylobacter sp. 19-13652]|uniref:COG3400 family protein n=1 Tax=Campylobacter sp. 19-13652 TaxID=2840180 RepID=UPI001C794AB9|nr:TrkA C-terminal domain-containing protein [Campylobacter sp. 19-13652]BCX79185.1 potassium transporter TrkA [Campylobacter sp. 19-13652]